MQKIENKGELRIKEGGKRKLKVYKMIQRKRKEQKTNKMNEQKENLEIKKLQIKLDFLIYIFVVLMWVQKLSRIPF